MNHLTKINYRFLEKEGLKERSSAGFTLIELAIVISMLAVMSAVAIPTVTRMVDNISSNRAAEEIVSDLHVARNLAIRRGRRATMTITSPTEYTVQWGNPVQTRTVDLSAFKGGAQFTDTPPGAASPDPVAAIIFSPQGFTQVSPQGWGDIYLTDENNTKVIRIEVCFSGAINQMRWAESGDTWVYR